MTVKAFVLDRNHKDWLSMEIANHQDSVSQRAGGKTWIGKDKANMTVKLKRRHEMCPKCPPGELRFDEQQTVETCAIRCRSVAKRGEEIWLSKSRCYCSTSSELSCDCKRTPHVAADV